MKNNQKGFSVVEILIVIVVVGLLGAAGWLVYVRQKIKTDANDNSISEQTQTVETAMTYTNKEFGFSFYHPNPGNVTVHDSDDQSTVKGKRYGFIYNNEVDGDFVTSDWATTYDTNAGKFNNCLPEGEKPDQVTTYLEEDGLCVKAYSLDHELYGEYQNTNAVLVVSKKFSDSAKIKALTFTQIIATDKPYTEATLKQAFLPKTEEAIQLAKSIKEL
ncbi:MAG: prepilin-type N-terminal cleavage/methylation domain-containing protein [Candidatus Saccharimonadales bacterium]